MFFLYVGRTIKLDLFTVLVIFLFRRNCDQPLSVFQDHGSKRFFSQISFEFIRALCVLSQCGELSCLRMSANDKHYFLK